MLNLPDITSKFRVNSCLLLLSTCPTVVFPLHTQFPSVFIIYLALDTFQRCPSTTAQNVKVSGVMLVLVSKRDK
jgi:hypothetical protein